MTEPDPVMAEIGRGIELSHSGEREAARELFAVLWGSVGVGGDAFHRCVLAHSMADVQDDPREELVWDLRALETADLISDERARQGGVAGPVASFYPSLHLNLGDVYRRLGNLDRARDHLARGRAAVGELRDDEYGRLIRGGLDLLAHQLSTA